jgi:hypothetical protein
VSDFLVKLVFGVAPVITGRSALGEFNGQGLTPRGESITGDPRNVIVDQVTLSARAHTKFRDR